MNLELIRNLKTERNKEQEEEFEKTMNFSLFFDSHPIINKIDSWKYSNLKRLLKNINYSKQTTFEYFSFNSNIEYLITELKLNVKFSEYILTNNEKIMLEKREVNKIHFWLSENKENKEKMVAMILFMIELINNKKDLLSILDIVLNKKISTLNFVIYSTLPIFLNQDI